MKKIILVTGSEGMIGKELVELLKQKEPDSLFRLVDKTIGFDLRHYQTCLNVMDNLLEAARIKGVKKFLYTSSIAVLNPDTDKFPAAAKAMGELQIEAYKIQYPEFGNNCYIVRPANVYGRYDKFDNPNSMVITSLIRKALTDATIEVWGDGSETREFINAKDVAKGMILTMQMMPDKPVNLGSGDIHSIKKVAEILSNLSKKPISYLLKEKRGDQSRVVYLDKNQANIEFKADVSLEEGIQEAYEYAKKVM